MSTSKNKYGKGLKLTPCLRTNSETYYKGRVNLHLGTLNDACFKFNANIILVSYRTCTTKQQDFLNRIFYKISSILTNVLYNSIYFYFRQI